MEEKKIIKKDNSEINLRKNTLNSVNQNTLDLCEEIKSTFPSYAIDKYSQTYNRSSVFDFSLLNLLKMPVENISNFSGAISNQKKKRIFSPTETSGIRKPLKDDFKIKIH
jgi:hypothetical protein